MYRATVIYHYESDGWWAESPNFPGFTAAGESFNEVRELVREGLCDFCEDELILEEIVIPIESADPITGNFSLKSEPKQWSRGYTEQQPERWDQDDLAHTASSDEHSEEEEQHRNLVFQV